MASKKQGVVISASGNPAKMVSGRGMGVAKGRAGFWRRHRWLEVAGGRAAARADCAWRGDLRGAAPRGADAARRDRREARRALSCARGAGQLSCFAGGRIDGGGQGLRIWPPAQVAGVTVPRREWGWRGDFTRAADSNSMISGFMRRCAYKPGKPIRISVVELKGLDVDVPPKTHFTHAATEGGIQ